MKITVTGASGLIGRAVCRLLKERGDSVVRVDKGVFGQMSETVVDGRHAGNDADLSDRAQATFALKGGYSGSPADAVIHLAGKRAAVTEQRTKGADLLFGNLRIDLNVLEAARELGIPGVYASTVSVYPEYAHYPPYKEHDARAFPAESVRYSAWGKLTSERLIEAMAEQDRLKWSVVRLVNTFGPHDNFGPDALVVPALIRRVHEGENPLRIFGDGTAERDLLYVDDAAAGIVAALTGPPGTYNLGRGEGVSVSRIVSTVLHTYGVERPVEWIPNGTTGASRKVVDPTKAREVLKWEPQITFEEGVRRTVEWYENDKGAR